VAQVQILKEGGVWARTWWRSIRALKCRATRSGDVYRVDGGVVIVSTAEGQVYRYRERPLVPREQVR